MEVEHVVDARIDQQRSASADMNRHTRQQTRSLSSSALQFPRLPRPSSRLPYMIFHRVYRLSPPILIVAFCGGAQARTICDCDSDGRMKVMKRWRDNLLWGHLHPGVGVGTEQEMKSRCYCSPRLKSQNVYTTLTRIRARQRQRTSEST